MAVSSFWLLASFWYVYEGGSRQPFPAVVPKRARSLLLLNYNPLRTSQQDNG